MDATLYLLLQGLVEQFGSMTAQQKITIKFLGVYQAVASDLAF